MATIAKIQRKSGVAFKAIIRDRTGRPIKSKTFTRKTDARAWAKRIEGDQEKIAAPAVRLAPASASSNSSSSTRSNGLQRTRAPWSVHFLTLPSRPKISDN